jgi:hypothetical protein
MVQGGYEGCPPCKNYWLCQAAYDNHRGGTRAGVKKLCINCDMMFGKELELVTASECPVCLEIKPSIIQPNCNHTICCECFKRMNYGDEDLANEPKFPYNSEIEEEYWEERPVHSDPRWELDPNIIRWRDECNAWDDARHPSENLRVCPLCRS